MQRLRRPRVLCPASGFIPQPLSNPVRLIKLLNGPAAEFHDHWPMQFGQAIAIPLEHRLVRHWIGRPLRCARDGFSSAAVLDDFANCHVRSVWT